jgi:exodeoxyribonuclease VII large subunit
VGHETDFTLADFAADRRAPTPSAAAEVATPEISELRTALWQTDARMARAVAQQLSSRRDRLDGAVRALQHLSPVTRVSGARQRVDDLTLRLDGNLSHRLERAANRLDGFRARLVSVNPEVVLSRGYAIVRERASREVLTSVRDARSGLSLAIQLKDGEFPARVEGQD